MVTLTEEAALAVASDPYYDGEEFEMSETTYTHIEYRLCAINDGRWGADTAGEDAYRVAENCATLLHEYARRNWPEAKLSIFATFDSNDCCSALNDDGQSFNADDHGTPCDALQELLSRHWTEEALWSPDFDAVVYLDNEVGE